MRVPARARDPADDSVRVYRSSGSSARERRCCPGSSSPPLPALAFVIAVAVLTLPQVIAGQSLLKGNPPGYGSASEKNDKSEPAEQDTRPAPTETEQEPETTAPESTTTTEEPDKTVPE